MKRLTLIFVLLLTSFALFAAPSPTPYPYPAFKYDPYPYLAVKFGCGPDYAGYLGLGLEAKTAGPISVGIGYGLYAPDDPGWTGHVRLHLNFDQLNSFWMESGYGRTGESFNGTKTWHKSENGYYFMAGFSMVFSGFYMEGGMGYVNDASYAGPTMNWSIGICFYDDKEKKE